MRAFDDSNSLLRAHGLGIRHMEVTLLPAAARLGRRARPEGLEGPYRSIPCVETRGLVA
jgi:hypothetical protein